MVGIPQARGWRRVAGQQFTHLRFARFARYEVPANAGGVEGTRRPRKLDLDHALRVQRRPLVGGHAQFGQHFVGVLAQQRRRTS